MKNSGDQKTSSVIKVSLSTNANNRSLPGIVTKEVSQLKGKDIKLISNDSDHTFYVLNDGNVVIIHESNSALQDYDFLYKNYFVYCVASGPKHTMLLTKHASGDYAIFGRGENDKIQVINSLISRFDYWKAVSKDNKGMVLVNSSCGDTFSGHINNDGRVFVFGESSLGRIGTNNISNKNIDSYMVQELEGISIIDLAASGNICLALSATGAVYMCAPREEKGVKPKQTPFVKFDQLSEKFIIKILAFKNRCAALSNDGIVYSWDCYKKEIKTINNPIIDDIAFFDQKYIACLASNHSLFVYDLDNLKFTEVQLPESNFSRIFHHCNGIAVTQSERIHSKSEIISNYCLSNDQNDSCPKLLYINQNNIDLFISPLLDNCQKNDYLNATFSSISAINGSFLIYNHPETQNDCLVDTKLVNEFYQKLKENKRMEELNTKFFETVNNLLIHQQADLESSKLRFLIIALLHPAETDSDMKFLRVIITFINISNTAPEVLKEWLKNFDGTDLQIIVNNLHKFFDNPNESELYTFNQDVAKVLSIVYSANIESKVLPPENFIHQQFSKNLNIIVDYNSFTKYLYEFPWMFTFETKINFIEQGLKDIVKELPDKISEQLRFEITINYSKNILNQIKTIFDPEKLDDRVFLPFYVKEENNSEHDGGGLTNRFFRVVEEQTFSGENPIFKKVSKDYYTFNENFDDLKMIEAIGIVFGCKLLNYQNLEIHFPPAFYKKLLQPEQKFTFEELYSFLHDNSSETEENNSTETEEINSTETEENNFSETEKINSTEPEENNFSETEENNSTETEENSSFETESYCCEEEENQNFTIEDEEEDFEIDEEEKERIEKFEAQYSSFQKGFRKIFVRTNINQILDYQEFKKYIEGSEADFDKLEITAKYDGYDKDCNAVRCFWNTVRKGLTKQEKRDLLIFITDKSVIPYKGLEITIAKSNFNYLTSYTCHEKLCIPNIIDENEMLYEIKFAISQDNYFSRLTESGQNAYFPGPIS